MADWKQTKIAPQSPPRRRLPGGRVKKRKYKISNKVEIAKLPETSVKIPGISHSSLQEQTADVLSIIAPRKSATTLQFVRKRPIQSKVAGAKKRKKCEDILMKQDILTGNNNTTLVETNYVPDSDANLHGSSGGGADTSLENAAESRIVEAGLADSSLCKVGSREGFVECRMPCPVVMNPTRKWTIEEDRKILYIHKENGSDLDLTLAAVQLELPEIPLDELRQRLTFLLNLLQCMESTGSKQV